MWYISWFFNCAKLHVWKVQNKVFRADDFQAIICSQFQRTLRESLQRTQERDAMARKIESLVIDNNELNDRQEETERKYRRVKLLNRELSHHPEKQLASFWTV